MSTVQTLTREVGGRAVPAPGSYTMDPTHSSVEAVARHLMVTKVRGRFSQFAGTVEIAEDPLESRVEAEIQAASIDTNEPQRDEHLRSPDFLDAERFPTLRFTSTAVRPVGQARWQVDGELTIRDVTRPVTLDVEFLGAGTDPYDNEKIAFSATTELDREAFGMTWNQALETGGVLVSKTLQVELEIQAVRG
jgi:polyisoprenoid-binding protein YceI